MRPVRIAINGFGRIGRTIFRILVRGGYPGIELVAVNDLAPLSSCAYLFEFDSTFGPYPGRVDFGMGWISVDGVRFPFHAEPDLRNLDLSGVDVVLECTGQTARAMICRGLEAGARSVLVSGPADEADATRVIGVNECLGEHERIISNASCTTNAMAPLLRALDDAFGITAAQATTVHCYTGSQPTVDRPGGDPARSRAAALSMVPTTTSAGRQIEVVLPQLAGKIAARAIRVPTASVSCIDLSFVSSRSISLADMMEFLHNLTAKSAVIGITNRPLVSCDLRSRPESLVVASAETSVVGPLARVFGWYDNEWGFSCRMLEMAERMGQRSEKRGA